jgi:hypothetical protein
MTSFSGTTPTDAAELQRLLASDAAADDQFGISVAISSDGSTLVVGADKENTSPNTNNGAAYVFTRSGSTWTEQAKLLASDAATDDQFGISVAISSDGNTVIVGSYLEDTSPNGANGAAYIFTRTAGVWTQQQKLLASDIDSGDRFGISVSISADGNTALIGAYLENTTVTDNGAAYIFTRSGSTWTEQAKLVALDRASNDEFGSSVAISADGLTAIIGAPKENTTATDQGAAYVFVFSGTWTEQAKLVALDAAEDDYFGNSVDISSDGNTAVINSDFGGDVGAVYIFTRSGTTWTQQQKFTGEGINAYLGGSVAISSNGNVIIATGNSYVKMYTFLGGIWSEECDLAIGSFLNSAISISADDSIALLGDYTYGSQGAAYLIALGRALDNKLYSYNPTLNNWDVSAHGETFSPSRHNYSESGTWNIPTGAKVVEVVCIGGGGGGGGGARNVSGDGGGSGGGGGGLSRYIFRAEDIGGGGANITITVGAGGTAGAATASGTTALSGNNGTSGGTTSFGTFLYAYGGANGIGGTTTARTGGAGGFGMFSGNAGGNTSTSATATSAGAGGGGGGGASFGTGSVPTASNLTQSGSAGSNGAGGLQISPGAGGNGRVSTTTTVSAAGAGGFFGGGGGGGGEGSTGGATGAGGAGGSGRVGACMITVWYG